MRSALPESRFAGTDAALEALRKEFNLPPGTPLGRAGRDARGGQGPAGAGTAGGGRQGSARGNALAALSDEQRAALQEKVDALDARFPPPPRATVKDFVDHIDYAVKLIGIDHVGISSDFDGGGGVDGWNGADETFNVTLELVRRGYTEPQIAKMWSGNLLRVTRQSAGDRKDDELGAGRGRAARSEGRGLLKPETWGSEIGPRASELGTPYSRICPTMQSCMIDLPGRARTDRPPGGPAA